jgi:cytochrome P450
MKPEACLEIAVLLLATWPALRFLSIPSIRREFTGIALFLAVCVVLYTIAVLMVAFYSPPLLRAGALGAGVFLLWERWRARSRYGTAAGLPPGSLALFPRRPWVDDLYYLRQAKLLGPVFKASLLHRPMICVYGAESGRELMRKHEKDLETLPVRFNDFIPRGFLRYMSQGDHRRYRKILQSAISAECLRTAEPAIALSIQSALLEMAENRERNSGLDINPRHELNDLFFRVFARLFLGISARHKDYRGLQKLYGELDIRKMSLIPSNRDRKALEQIVILLHALGRGLVDQDAREQQDSQCILAGLLHKQPAALGDDTLVGNLVYVIHIGRTDLTSLGVWVLKILADNREWWERFCDEVSSGNSAAAESLATRIIKESLRLEQSEYLYRRAVRDIRFRGHLIPEGWRVRILIREGHRDPKLFESPGRFNPDRFLHDTTAGSGYAPFGLGSHSCIGSHVTLTVMRNLLMELARGFEWHVLRDGPREYGWAHWQPSSRFRISLTARGDGPRGFPSSQAVPGVTPAVSGHNLV